jgi:hypothetical protein
MRGAPLAGLSGCAPVSSRGGPAADSDSGELIDVDRLLVAVEPYLVRPRRAIALVLEVMAAAWPVGSLL